MIAACPQAAFLIFRPSEKAVLSKSGRLKTCAKVLFRRPDYLYTMPSSHHAPFFLHEPIPPQPPPQTATPRTNLRLALAQALGARVRQTLFLDAQPPPRRRICGHRHVLRADARPHADAQCADCRLFPARQPARSRVYHPLHQPAHLHAALLSGLQNRCADSRHRSGRTAIPFTRRRPLPGRIVGMDDGRGQALVGGCAGFGRHPRLYRLFRRFVVVALAYRPSLAQTQGQP